MMYERLLALYLSGRIDEVALSTAVAKNWITEEQREQIIASK